MQRGTMLLIVVLNLAMGLTQNVHSSFAFPIVPSLPMLALLCGYLASRSGSLLITLAEASYVVSITLARSNPTLLLQVGLAHLVGIAIGVAKRRGSYELRLGMPVNCGCVLTSIGLSLLGSGLLGAVDAPLITPLGAIVRRGVSAELAFSMLLSYGTQAYLSSLHTNSNALVLLVVSLLAPYTLPLFPVLTSGDYGERPGTRYLRLGRVVEVIKDSKVRELLLPYERGLNRNILIIGATGTGKSTLAKNLVRQLRALGVPTVVFDPHGEYCRDLEEDNCVDASELSVNLFEAYEEDPKTRAELIVDAISEVYPLGSLQRIALVKALVNLYGSRGKVGFDDLLEYLWQAARGEVDLGIPQAVIRSLIPYVESLKDTFKVRGRKIVDLVNLTTVVDFSRLSVGISRIVAELAIDELYRAFRDSNTELVVVVDEAHRFLRKGEAIPRIFREGRKYGISAIVVTQDVSSVPRELLLNSAAVVSFLLPEVSSARYVAKIMSPDDQATYERILGRLASLPRFHAVVHVLGRGSYIVRTVPETRTKIASRAQSRAQLRRNVG